VIWWGFKKYADGSIAFDDWDSFVSAFKDKKPPASLVC
jgi:hypothetical protein